MSASDFTRSASPALTELIANAPNAEAIREICKSQSVADGILVRERGNGYGDQLSKEAENAVPTFAPSEAAAPSAPRRETFLQVVYPGGNSRFEVAAVSQEELDARVAQVYAMSGGKR